MTNGCRYEKILSIKRKAFFKTFSTESLFISALAFLFICLSIIETLFSIQFNEKDKILPQFITNIIFFNAIHLGFTFFLIYETEAFLNWRKHAPKSKLSFENKLALLFICFWIFQFFKYDIFYNLGSLFILFYAYYHTIKQQLGISLSLNHKLSHLSRKSHILMSRFDHIFFNLLILITWLFLSLDHFLHLKHINIIYIQCSYLSIISLYILMSYLFFGKIFFLKKALFFPRLLLYPFLPTSFLALMGVLSIHGVEYFFVTKNFISIKEIKRVFFSFGSLLFLIVVFLCLVNHKIGVFALFDIKSPEPFHKLFFVTLGACQLLHYWIDGQIFKMKDPLVRKYIAPVLNNNSE